MANYQLASEVRRLAAAMLSLLCRYPPDNPPIGCHLRLNEAAMVMVADTSTIDSLQCDWWFLSATPEGTLSGRPFLTESRG